MIVAKRIGLLFAILLLGYSSYLTWRILEERKHAPQVVRDILRQTDPAIAHIPQRRIDMLLRIEDPTFWTHDGLDFRTPGAGFTTISQGLGKSIFFDRFAPGAKKLELLALTRFALEPTVAKKDILFAFLNSAYLGNDGSGEVVGFAAGATRWIGKPIDQLNDHEFLTLVAMLPAPNELDPIHHSGQNAERVRRIERLLDGKCAPDGLNDVYLDGCR